MRKPPLIKIVLLSIFFACLTGLKAQAQRIIPGDEAYERVRTLTGAIHWNDDIYSAESEAQRQGKLVFWVQMLGHIDGAT